MYVSMQLFLVHIKKHVLSRSTQLAGEGIGEAERRVEVRTYSNLLVIM